MCNVWCSAAGVPVPCALQCRALAVPGALNAELVMQCQALKCSAGCSAKCTEQCSLHCTVCVAVPGAVKAKRVAALCTSVCATQRSERKGIDYHVFGAVGFRGRIFEGFWQELQDKLNLLLNKDQALSLCLVIQYA